MTALQTRLAQASASCKLAPGALACSGLAQYRSSHPAVAVLFRCSKGEHKAKVIIDTRERLEMIVSHRKQKTAHLSNRHS